VERSAEETDCALEPMRIVHERRALKCKTHPRVGDQVSPNTELVPIELKSNK